MKQIPVKLGPLALLLTVISICLTTLSILSFTTARADMSLAEKYAETVRIRYELEAQGQSCLADAQEGILPPDAETDADGVVWMTLKQDGSILRIGLVSEAGGYRVVSWRHEREWTQDTSIGNLWNGN